VEAMKKSSRLVLFLLSAALAVTLLVAAPGKPRAADELQPPLFPSVSDFDLYDQADYTWKIRLLYGEDIELSAFKNNVVFLHFWATWCPHCAEQMYSIQRLYESLGNKDDIVFILASYQDKETVRRYLLTMKISLPIYFYKWPVPPAFEPRRRIPRTFIIDRTGQIVYQHVGPAKWDDPSVVNFLESLK
jgi:thiol-disulfide isomerase/thioredoxin